MFSASSEFSTFLFKILEFYLKIPSTKFREEGDGHSFMHAFIHFMNEYFLRISCVSGAVVGNYKKVLNKVSQVLVPWNLHCWEGDRQYTMGWSDLMHVKHLPHGLAHNKCSINYCYHYLFWLLLLDRCSWTVFLGLHYVAFGARLTVVVVLLDKVTKVISLRKCLGVWYQENLFERKFWPANVPWV